MAIQAVFRSVILSIIIILIIIHYNFIVIFTPHQHGGDLLELKIDKMFIVFFNEAPGLVFIHLI